LRQMRMCLRVDQAAKQIQNQMFGYPKNYDCGIAAYRRPG